MPLVPLPTTRPPTRAASPCRPHGPALTVLALLALALVTVPLTAADTPDQVIEKAYGPQLAAAKATPDPKDDTALAENLLSDSQNTKQEPAMQAAMLKPALRLAVEDPDGWSLANKILAAWVRTGQVEEAAAWQELVKCGRDALRRRGQGKADIMLRPYFDWQLQGVWLALQAGDNTAADRQLNTIIGELRQAQLKYEMDFAGQIQARIRFMAPFNTAIATACKRVDGAKGAAPSDDPKLNLAAGETILAQTGDWRAARPYLTRAKDKTWDTILAIHRGRADSDRSPADTLLPSPVDIFPGNRPSRATAATPAAPLTPATPVTPAAAGTADPATAPEHPPENAPVRQPKTGRRLVCLPVGITQEMVDTMAEDRYLALKQALDEAFKVTPKERADYESSHENTYAIPPAYHGPNGRYMPTIPDNMTTQEIDALSDAAFEGLKRALIKALPPDYLKRIEDQRNQVEAAVAKVNAQYPPGPNEKPAPPAAGDNQPGALPAPTASGASATELLAAATCLENLAAPARHPSPVGRVALCREIAFLLTQAQAADQAGLTAGEKLGLITRQRAAQDAADKATTDLLDAFDRTARLNWTNLSSGGLRAHWTSTTAFAHWKDLAGNVFEAKDGTWDNRLTCKSAKTGDFVLEFEVFAESEDAHPLLFLREHNGQPYFQLDLMPRHTYLTYRPLNSNQDQQIVALRLDFPAKAWTPVRVMFDDDHYMLWINQYQAVSTIAKRNADPGNLCLIGLNGTYRLRNIRIRELR